MMTSKIFRKWCLIWAIIYPGFPRTVPNYACSPGPIITSIFYSQRIPVSTKHLITLRLHENKDELQLSGLKSWE